MNEKPSLDLIEGKEVLDPESLKDLYVNQTGKEPTAVELEEANALLEESNAENVAKLGPRA